MYILFQRTQKKHAASGSDSSLSFGFRLGCPKPRQYLGVSQRLSPLSTSVNLDPRMEIFSKTHDLNERKTYAFELVCFYAHSFGRKKGTGYSDMTRFRHAWDGAL